MFHNDQWQWDVLKFTKSEMVRGDINAWCFKKTEAYSESVTNKSSSWEFLMDNSWEYWKFIKINCLKININFCFCFTSSISYIPPPHYLFWQLNNSHEKCKNEILSENIIKTCPLTSERNSLNLPHLPDILLNFIWSLSGSFASSICKFR